MTTQSDKNVLSLVTGLPVYRVRIIRRGGVGGVSTLTGPTSRRDVSGNRKEVRMW